MMYRFLLITVISIFGLLPQAVLLADYKLDSKKMRDITISSSGITRITISDDEIADVISPAEANKGFVLHSSGNLYVHGAELIGKTSVSLISSKGIVQDLRIIPKPLPTNHPVIFIEPIKKINSHKQITNYLGEFIRGVIPSNFSISTKEFKPREFKHIKAKPECSYSTENYPFFIDHYFIMG